jgi:hypothetical protein
MRLWPFAFFGLALILVVSACDNYNIVEPRFYSDDQLENLVDLNESNADSLCDSTWLGHGLPTAFSLGVGWLNKSEHHLIVTLALPITSEARVAVLGSSGNVVKMLFDSTGIGQWAFNWCCRDENGNEVPKGIYGVTMFTIYKSLQRTVWFKIE